MSDAISLVPLGSAAVTVSHPVPALKYSRWKQGLEIAVAFAAIQATLWTAGEVKFFLHFFATTWILTTTFLRRKQIPSLGLSTAGIRESIWIVWLSIVVALAFAVAARAAGTLHQGITVSSLGVHIAAYSLWALMQQFIAQSYFFIRFESLLGSGRRAVLPTAVLFAAAHMPNPVLLIATGLGGIALTEVFRRYRTLYTIAVAHAVVGVAITLCLPDDLHRHMRVGIGYLHYHSGVQAKAGFLPRADRVTRSPEPDRPEHVYRSVGNR